MFTEPGTAREEAERLVAAVLAAATLAANANPQISTGSAECCVCPLCKVIAAVRDPDPQTVERLATGAGDLAAGVASFLRHIGSAAAGAKDAWATASDPHENPPTRDHSTHAAHGASRDDAEAPGGDSGAARRGKGASGSKGTRTEVVRASATGWPGDRAAGNGVGDQVPGPRKAPKKVAPAKATQPKASQPKKAAGIDGAEPKVAKVVKKAIRKKTES